MLIEFNILYGMIKLTKRIDFDNQILVIFDPTYLLQSQQLKSNNFVGNIFFCKNLHLVGCSIVCSKSEAMITYKIMYPKYLGYVLN